MANALQKLTLTEIAYRIYLHLQKIEAAQPKDGKAISGRFYGAGSSVHGNMVGIVYVSYQGSSNITRDEALHYLAGLDAGFKGRHYEYFRKEPPPKPADPEVRFTALVRARFGYLLYAVTKRTESRVYGKKVMGDGYAASFVSREDVVKMQATPEDLKAVQDAEKRRDAAIDAAHEKCRKEIRAIINSKGENNG